MRFLLLLILMLNSLPAGALPSAEIASGGFAVSEKKALGDWTFDGSRRAEKLGFEAKFASVGMVYMQHRYMDP
ncbi:MAG: hypothetical protein GY814_14015, partial [Gammaproteobacteria bacterium]|nr:hypothetical protein [Gammaproteobacteria bacterium]